MDIKYIINLKNLLSFLITILVFVLIIDPTNTILGIKDITFVLVVVFCCVCYPRVNGTGIIVLIGIIFVLVITSLNISYFDYKYDIGYTLSVFKSLSPLVLLLWVDKLKLIGKLTLPTLMVAIIVFVTYIIYHRFPVFFSELYAYYMSHGATMMIGERSFIGFKLISFFYKTLPVLLIPLSIFMYRLFNSKQKKLMNIVVVIAIFLTVILSGTRSSMLASAIIFGINLFAYLLKSRAGRQVFLPIIIASLTCFFIIFLKLVSDNKEASIQVKFQNIESYVELIQEHPSIFILGQGAGSYFYIKGRNEEVLVTEWSYLEIFRMFGVFGALFIYIVFLYPLYIFYEKRQKLEEWKPLFLGYLLYLLVGATNPLLLGSTGMLVLLIAYSYAFNPYYESKLNY